MVDTAAHPRRERVFLRQPIDQRWRRGAHSWVKVWGLREPKDAADLETVLKRPEGKGSRFAVRSGASRAAAWRALDTKREPFPIWQSAQGLRPMVRVGFCCRLYDVS